MKLLILTIFLLSNACILEGCAGQLPNDNPKTPTQLIEDARVIAISLDSQVGTLAELKSISKPEAQKLHNDIVGYQKDLDTAGGLLRDAIPGNDQQAIDQYTLILRTLLVLRTNLAEKAK